jgi:N-acetylglucosamine-6-sulfatase
MRCRRRLRWLATLSVALATPGLAGCDDGEEPERAARDTAQPSGVARAVPGAVAGPREQPNIVLVMTDDQDLRSLRVMPTVRARLARRGTRFSRYYATFPLCCPARATLLTGQYAHNHGVLGNKPPEGGYPALADRADTLGVWLQDAGYRTAWIGKFLNGYGREGDYRIAPGWSNWQVPVELTELRMYGYRLNENGRIVAYGSEPADYQTDVLADKAVEFIRTGATRSRPFFLTLSPLAPHDEADTIDTGNRDPRPAPRHLGTLSGTPLARPPSFNERDVADKPGYVAGLPRLGPEDLRAMRPQLLGRLESLLAVDEAVGRIVAALRQTGQLEDTVILFTSDNGLVLGEHRLATAKSVPYEEATHMPLIARGPGFEPRARRAKPTANVDLTATILDLAGAQPTRVLDGSSLLPLARDPGALGDRPVLLESDSWAGLRAGRWSYVEYPGDGAELYDLAHDPYQLENLAGRPSYRDVRETFAGELERLRDCAGRGCRAPFEAPRPP